MAIHGPFINATIWFGPVDLSGNANKVELHGLMDDLDTTTFASAGVHTRTGGLFDTTCAVEGYAETGTGLQDATMSAAFAANTHAMAVSPTGADGSLVLFFSALQDDYSIGGPVGQILPFTQATKGRDQYGLTQGTIMLPKTTLGSTSNGSVATLGAVGSTQSLYASLHVFSASGGSPTLDVVVKSAAVSFTSPTTRLTFAQMTAAGDQYATPVAGPFTDTFWRVTATVGGSSPSFVAAVCVGIK